MASVLLNLALTSCAVRPKVFLLSKLDRQRCSGGRSSQVDPKPTSAPLSL